MNYIKGIALVLLVCLASTQKIVAQYAFELKIEYAMRVQNSDLFSISGTVISGRIESGKSYYMDDGQKVEVKNVISSKSATSVPVALAQENVSISLQCKDYQPDRGEVLRCISSKPIYGGNVVNSHADKMQEGMLKCKLNSRVYTSTQISKPVYIKQADVLDLFFEAEDKSVIWLQLNDFSQIKDTPHQAKSDTSNHDRMYVCKVAYMPLGYRPTDMPNNYVAYEDVKGNAGIIITYLDKYKKKIGLEFSGILRPNQRLLVDKPNAGLFYINEGRVDEIGWDEF
jgi:hypothetical protein